MYLHCLIVVHVQKILLPCLDPLKTVPVLLCHGTINVLDFIYLSSWRLVMAGHGTINALDFKCFRCICIRLFFNK